MRLILDSHIPRAVAVQLRRQGIDALILAEWIDADLLDEPDQRIIRAAHDDERVFATYDCKTVPDLLRTLYAEDETHAGVVLIDVMTIHQDDVGGLVRTFIRLVEERGNDDWTNRVHYLRFA